jgi:hypothetical protein
LRYKKSRGSKYSRKQGSPYRSGVPYGTAGVYGGQDNAWKYYRHHPPVKYEKEKYEKIPKEEHGSDRVIKIESTPEIKFPEYHPEVSQERIRSIVNETFAKMKLEEELVKNSETPIEIEKTIDNPLEVKPPDLLIEKYPDPLDLAMPDLKLLENELLYPFNPLEIPLEAQKKDFEKRKLEAGEYNY